MPNLLRHTDDGQHSLTPEDARAECPNWRYVGFDLIRLAQGETLERKTGDQEHLLVPITGR
ncbi:MAG: 5-deoxy-glucuronate isomerase, partial [Shimia sp.]